MSEKVFTLFSSVAWLLQWLMSLVLLLVGPRAALAEDRYECVPSPRQLVWSANEFEVFIHFGLNSQSSQEWGSGRETAKSFDPVALEERQWVQAIAASTASGVVLVCKHHEGFCLRPSQLTDHSVRQSPWREGKGDFGPGGGGACRETGLRGGAGPPRQTSFSMRQLINRKERKAGKVRKSGCSPER